MSSYLWIDQASTVTQATEIRQSAAVALDTEFVRTDTFYPLLGLVQIATSSSILLMDALQPSCLDMVADTLLSVDQQPVWVLHSCAEDLEVVFNQWGCLPRQVVDTQLAAAFLGRARQMSLQNLLATEMNVHLTKDETRSNWCQRPLSNAQLTYAAEDVRYLLPLWDKLSAELMRCNRMEWFREDCEKLIAKASRQVPFDQVYLQFHDAWQLKEKPLAVLQALARWREEVARKHNKPRGFIIKDPVLYAVAERLPKNATALSAIPNIAPATIRRYADEILHIVNETAAVPGLAKPVRPLGNHQRDLMKRIKSWLEVQAEHLQMPVELLAGRKHLEHLIRQKDDAEAIAHEEWRGWRQEVLEPGIIEIMQAFDEA